MIMNFIRGFCMALADSVPGVSGGTIAFLLGFYDKFITSLHDIVSKDKEKRKKAFFFLIKLGIGWIVGFCLAVLILGKIFNKHIYAISSLFLGFIIFAIPIVIREEKDTIKGKYKHVIFAIIGILIVFLITYFNPVSGKGLEINIQNLNIGLVLYVFIAAMIAISAMVLPGISGSTILLVFGLYVPIITAIKDILHFQFQSLPIIIIFALGMITGIITTISFIKKALEKYRSQTIYMIIGLMLGSLYAIVMGPTTLDVPKDPMGFQTFQILFFILGGLLILGLQLAKTKLSENND